MAAKKKPAGVPVAVWKAHLAKQTKMSKQVGSGLWVCMRAEPIGNGNYVVQVWYVNGSAEEEPQGSSAATHGYPRTQIHMAHLPNHRMAERYVMNHPPRQVLPALAAKRGKPTPNFEVLPVCDISMIAFHVKAHFAMDDAQLAREHGVTNGDPEDFYEATGEWPSAGTNYEIEMAVIPTTPWTIVQDVASAREEGWRIHNPACENEVTDREIVGTKKRFEEMLQKFLKAGTGLPAFYRFAEDPVWTVDAT